MQVFVEQDLHSCYGVFFVSVSLGPFVAFLKRCMLFLFCDDLDGWFWWHVYKAIWENIVQHFTLSLFTHVGG